MGPTWIVVVEHESGNLVARYSTEEEAKVAYDIMSRTVLQISGRAYLAVVHSETSS